MTNGVGGYARVSLFCEQNREGNHGAVRSTLPRSLHRNGRRTPTIVSPTDGNKSPLRHKATAVRSSDLIPANPATAARRPVDLAPATVESLGRQLKEALALRRLQSLSIWDSDANVQWLNEGALGPDEHTLVLEAFDELKSDRSLTYHETALEDCRYALFLPVRSPSSQAVGVVMVLADVKAMSDGAQESIATPAVRAIMQRLAVLMRPAGHSTTLMPALAVLELAEEPPALQDTPAAAPPPAEAAAAAISPQAVHDLLEFELGPDDRRAFEAAAPGAPAPDDTSRTPEAALPEMTQEVSLLEFIPAPPVLSAATEPAPAPVRNAAPVANAPGNGSARSSAAAQRARTVHPPAPALPAATADSQLILEVLQFGKLRAGGQSRRFQVQARMSQRDGHPQPAATDAFILQGLVSWLAAHRSGWSAQPTSFTINLSIATLEDERFAQRMAGTLNSNGLSPEVLGFEITEALCTQRRALVERFITQCEKVGSWVVIDDFSFDSQVLPLLRSKAVRLVKLDQKLTATAMKDKLSQALVIATVQAVKVLGIHCAAKQIESQATLQWLTAIGCDFAQGSALSRAQPLDSLARAPVPD
jgi:EAL domain-containing protein (putative c-di-GMP-specific phosphodiesterase class I)